MSKTTDKDDKLLITSSDILSLFRRSKKRILYFSLFFGVLGVLFTLIRPVVYNAEATFREKSNKSGNISTSLIELLGNDSNTQENEASSLFKSRKILQDVVEKLHLQGHLQQDCEMEGWGSNIKNNLLIFKRAFFKSSNPVLPDIHCPIQLTSLNYSGEIPLTLTITINDDDSFHVKAPSNSKITENKGEFELPFISNQLSFTLTKVSDKLKPSQTFFLTVKPLVATCDELSKKLEVETVKTDKGVLKLSYMDRDRHRSSIFINTTMECYQNYLKKNHDRLALIQINYLQDRQNQLGEKLADLMKKHADFLKNDLFNSGFVDSNKEMDFLAKSQHEYRDKLLANELELKRLENVQSSNYVYYDSYRLHEGDSQTINTVLTEIRHLKQRRDGLEIELQKKTALKKDSLHFSLDKQLDELKETQQHMVDLQDVMDRFHQNLPPSPSLLLSDPRFLIQDWFERLNDLENIDPIEWQKSRENFLYYLGNLERLFSVYEKILQTRLTHQQSSSGEYQGINLKIAEELYVDYSKRLIDLEATIRQNLFFITQMENENFEITSLSAGLIDPISQEMIKKASHLVLTLKDQNNQSVKEQERLKNELALQRTFLTLHLKQMIELMELNKKLINEKIYVLQNVSLELIHQQMSLLENTLKDYVESRLENLRQERVLIRQHLRNIHKEMGGLPQKWVAEQQIDQELQTNRLIVEEIAKMVESKNISHNLEMIQSAPIDLSVTPVHPVTPKLIPFALLGSLFGGMLGAGLTLGSTLKKGLTISQDNLKLLGHHVSGVLSSSYCEGFQNMIFNDDLETLRRLRSFLVSPLEGSSIKINKLLLIEGMGPDYSSDLANLFVKKGKKIIRILLNFGQAETSSNGLLQYLEGQIKFPSIEKTVYGDQIVAGGMSRYSAELLSSKPFEDLIQELQKQYDYIIGVSPAFPISAEAESLIPLFNSVAVSVSKEKVEELDFYARLSRDHKHKVTFIVVDSDMI
ncbi:Wzz/FepE/Etk N-terminal domain-containing protein [Candidatus Protochlamydia amoebophila]|uniref:Wzz/FepE/Etk N-terminal domain-containing protein n=1 Tax=Candidatus Protochlamydia amoebophila TaxID=362787 RepID=UPI001BC9568F|nr:Wzz/FepE/Etk N-terminal domain-containing protein [Candidatus Protochlamydia amoebophila]